LSYLQQVFILFLNRVVILFVAKRTETNQLPSFLRKAKKRILSLLILFLPSLMIGQGPPPLGTSSSFAAVTNTASPQITGNVGTNSDTVTGFGNNKR
jgi:hypothetical protein